MDTEIFDVLVKETGRSKAELHDWAKSENELNEICTAEEIAGPILFLASDASSFISGAHIPIAGAAQVQAHAHLLQASCFPNNGCFMARKPIKRKDRDLFPPLTAMKSILMLEIFVPNEFV